MDNQERVERYAKWEQLIKEQGKSGQTQKVFCKERNISISKLSYYRSALKPRSPASKASVVPLTPITIKKPDVPEKIFEIKVTLPNGFQCVIPTNAHVSYVKSLLGVLSSC